MSRNEIIMTVAAGALIGFSLIVSLVVPRWKPDFPGRRTGLFAVVAALFVFGMLGAVEVVGAEDHNEAAAETIEGPGGGTETVGETESTKTETGKTETGGGGSGESDQIKEGEDLFAANNCAGCHTLEKADASGTVGPNLDELQPSADAVVAQVTNGGGGMPAFGGSLSADQIQALAAYVVDATSR